MSGEDRQQGLTKFIRRASKVLRPKSVISPPRLETEATPSEPRVIPSSVTSPPLSPAEALASNPPGQAPLVQTVTPMAGLNTALATEPTSVDIPRSRPAEVGAHVRLQQEKAKVLFAKYGFTMEDRDWTPISKRDTPAVAWVEKKIRLRVHRECHKCHTSFGSGKICVQCSHTRCKACPRWPPKAGIESAQPPTAGMAKIEQEMDKAQPMDDSETAVEPDVQQRAAISVGKGYGASKELDISPPNQTDVHIGSLVIDPILQTDKLRSKQLNKTHQRRGVDVVYRPPQHRVRRACHKCETLFKGRATECEKCHHTRCPNCPRDPVKFSKFPEGQGYPGDTAEPEPTYPALERVWRKPRHRVRWICHECDAAFASSNAKSCANCKHSRCGLCTRTPNKKHVREHSEELLRGLEGKLSGLKLLPEGSGQSGTTEV